MSPSTLSSACRWAALEHDIIFRRDGEGENGGEIRAAVTESDRKGLSDTASSFGMDTTRLGKMTL